MICPLSVRGTAGCSTQAYISPQALKGGVGGIYSFDSAPNTLSSNAEELDERMRRGGGEREAKRKRAEGRLPHTKYIEVSAVTYPVP
jgi:hypothetical protein